MISIELFSISVSYNHITDTTPSSGTDNVTKETTSLSSAVPTLSLDVAMESNDANKISSGISVETVDIVTTEFNNTETTNLLPSVTIIEATDTVTSGNKLHRQYAVAEDDELPHLPVMSSEPVEGIDDVTTVTTALSELSIGNVLCVCSV